MKMKSIMLMTKLLKNLIKISHLRNLYQVHYRSNIFSKYLLNVSHLRIISPWIVLLRLSILEKAASQRLFLYKTSFKYILILFDFGLSKLFFIDIYNANLSI